MQPLYHEYMDVQGEFLNYDDFNKNFRLKKVDSFDRWLIDHEDTASFPYRFSFWEYSREGHLDGVPGDSFLYARITMPEQILIEEKK